MAWLDLKLGYTCNNNCIHCVIADSRADALKVRGKEDLSTQECMYELMDSWIKGCTKVVFTGGEPTIRKDILKLIRYAKQIGYAITMQTNGRILSKKNVAKKFSLFGVSYVIALHGHTADVHDSISRAAGSFGQTVKGIKNLIELKQQVCGKVVISKKNCRYLIDIVRFFIELRIKNIAFSFPHGQGNARKYFNDVVPKYSDIEKYVYQSIEYVKDYNKKNRERVSILFEAIPFCFMKNYEEYIIEEKSNAPVKLKQFPSPPQDWSQVRLKIKEKFPKCKECICFHKCEGPWKEYPKKYGSGEFKPVKE